MFKNAFTGYLYLKSNGHAKSHVFRSFNNTKIIFLERFFLFHRLRSYDSHLKYSLCWSKDFHLHFDTVLYEIMRLIRNFHLKGFLEQF